MRQEDVDNLCSFLMGSINDLLEFLREVVKDPSADIEMIDKFEQELDNQKKLFRKLLKSSSNSFRHMLSDMDFDSMGMDIPVYLLKSIRRVVSSDIGVLRQSNRGERRGESGKLIDVDPNLWKNKK